MTKKGLDLKTEKSLKLDLQIRAEIIEFIFQGYPFSDVVDYLELNYNISHENARRMFKNAKIEILNIGDFDFDQIIIQHIFYYEEAIRYFDGVGNFSAKAVAMSAKEKLLKIYEEDEPKIEIENNVNIEIGQLDFDIDKLNVQEKERFQTIFEKVKFLDGKSANNK